MIRLQSASRPSTTSSLFTGAFDDFLLSLPSSLAYFFHSSLVLSFFALGSNSQGKTFSRPFRTAAMTAYAWSRIAKTRMKFAQKAVKSFTLTLTCAMQGKPLRNVRRAYLICRCMCTRLSLYQDARPKRRLKQSKLVRQTSVSSLLNCFT